MVDPPNMGDFNSLPKSVNLSKTTNNKCLYFLSVDHLLAGKSELKNDPTLHF